MKRGEAKYIWHIMDIENVEVEKEIKIVFMGTPLFSVPVLDKLIKNYNVVAVVTQPDKRIGRGGKIGITPIKQLASNNNILVLQPERIKEEYNEIIALEPDIIITCAYGQIIPKELLDYPKYGCINVHASLLPKLRGGAPIQRAIMNGYDKTGITIMYMAEKMDSGDIIKSKEIDIPIDMNYKTLHDKLSLLGSELLIEVLPDIISGNISPVKQNEDEVTYGFNISKEDEKINFSNSKLNIYNQIRALDGFSGAYCNFQGKRLKVWKSMITDNHFSDQLNGEITKIYKNGIGVKVSDGEIILLEVQPEGKKRMDALSFANGVDLLGKVLE